MTTVEVRVRMEWQEFRNERTYPRAVWSITIQKASHRVTLPAPGWRGRLRNGR